MFNLDKFYKYFERISSYVLFIVSIILLFIIIWGLNKGFDISDEGFLIAGFIKPHDINIGSFYQMFFNKIFFLFKPTILFYRIIRLVFSIMSIGYCYSVISKHILKKSPIKPIHLSFLFLGMLLIGVLYSYSIYSTILSYNNLTLLIGILAIAIYIDFIELTSLRKGIFLITICSFLVCFQFFTRFPSAILLLMVFYWMIIISKFRLKTKLFFSILISILILCMAYVFVFMLYENSFLAYIKDYQQSIKLLENHNMHQLIVEYKNEITYLYEHAIGNHIALLLSILITTIAIKYLDLYPRFKILIVVIQLVLVGYFLNLIIHSTQHISGIVYNAVALEPILFLITIFLVINLFTTTIQVTPSLKKISTICLLLVYPLIGSIGTNNDLPTQILQFIFFWGIAMFLIYIDNYQKTSIRFMNIVLIVAMFFILISQTISGYVYHPYRNTSNLINNTIATDNSFLSHIYLDKNMNQSILSFSKLVKQEKSNKKEIQIIDFCKLPGIVYLLNGYTPRNAWMSRNVPKYNIYMYQSTKNIFTPDYVFLPTNYDKDSNIQAYFTGIELNLTDQYLLLDSLKHPLYDYKPMPIKEYVYVFSKIRNDAKR